MSEPVKVDVWMPLYIADYLSSTSRLTTVQHGAYMLLIMDYWKNGKLPDDDSILAQIVKMSPDAWSIARAVLVQFFSIENGEWTHARIESEMAIENEVVAQLNEVKAIDPNVNENALFLHANKYGFRDLKLAHQNMSDMSNVVKKTQTMTAQNIAKRNDPVNITPGGTSNQRPDPSQFSNSVEYLRSLKN